MNAELESAFHEEMISIYYSAGKATGYWANRFLQKVRKDGGLLAARQRLKLGKGISPGLQRLAKEKRVDLSMEALILKEPWRKLFTDQEINEATKRVQVASKMAEL